MRSGVGRRLHCSPQPTPPSHGAGVTPQRRPHVWPTAKCDTVPATAIATACWAAKMQPRNMLAARTGNRATCNVAKTQPRGRPAKPACTSALTSQQSVASTRNALCIHARVRPHSGTEAPKAQARSFAAATYTQRMRARGESGGAGDEHKHQRHAHPCSPTMACCGVLWGTEGVMWGTVPRQRRGQLAVGVDAHRGSARPRAKRVNRSLRRRPRAQSAGEERQRQMTPSER